MTKEHLVPKFEFGLEYINFSDISWANNDFILKEYLKLKNPYWPSYLRLLADPTLKNIDFKNCFLVKDDMELIAIGLHNNPCGNNT